ncbi:basic secretory protein-like protein [Actinomadura sp. HBU206391]|uniref:basic secretory protein-like protein n=1 Tax=Actinomadura sp. HBU206391 TaxID=2731692 RepID=UPI0016501C68|nr:basic secretory protein-like protein [Actinomadura sp. HBU206391]MBC6462438.1 hypothetical protein [Actinomadura sp. HBU206391]
MEPESPGPPFTITRLRKSRSPRLFAAAIGVAVAVNLVSGVGYVATAQGRDPSAEGATAALRPALPDSRDVDAVLAGRARAVRDRDRQAFLATVASAPAAFQADQTRLFTNLTALPLSGWRQQLETAEPLVTGPDGTTTLRITLRYRLRGFDRAEVAHTQYLTFGRRPDAGWVIVGDGASRGLRDDAEIWDAGRLTVVRGRHSLVIGNQPAGARRNGPKTTLRAIARRLDAAVPIVTGVVGTRWDRRVVALVPADRAEAEGLVGGRQDLTRIAALATVSQGGTTRSPGEDRIVISPETFGRLSERGRRVVLTHELTHVATGGARDGRTPMWLIEGLADYVGYKNARFSVRSAARELRDEVIKGRLPAALPDRTDFGSSSDRLPQAYEEAWLACRMVAERYGEATLLRLYRAAGRRGDAAFKEILDVPPAEFVAMWRDYLRKELA